MIAAAVSSNSLPATDGQNPRKSNPEVHTYEIRKTRSSESAMIFFAYCLDTKQRIVIKVLRDYKDTRYNLTDPQKRLECQIEALQWNQKFTPDIYLGLGRIVKPGLSSLMQNAKENSPHHTRRIIIEDITDDIQQLSTITNPGQEYALIMERLPKERRLDYLLRQRNTGAIYEILGTLVTRIVEMHEFAPYPDVTPFENNERRWGSYEQLKDKLLHNTGLFDNLERLDNRSFHKDYSWLMNDLNKFIEDPVWHQYFNQRLEQGRIKRCHGDLKARNIWIESVENSSDPAHHVRILDAIDFNPSYCNIDVLSDIAMLIVDVEAVDTHLHERDDLGNRGSELALFIRDTYYAYAKENKEDATTQLVLTYYLLEKALVRAAISLFYDRNEHPQLGPYFLRIAVKYMAQLKDLLQIASSSSIKDLATIA